MQWFGYIEEVVISSLLIRIRVTEIGTMRSDDPELDTVILTKVDRVTGTDQTRLPLLILKDKLAAGVRLLGIT